MLNRSELMLPELALLLACCRLKIREQDELAIRQLLEAGIDWTVFARKAVDHGLACLAGQSLARAAPDLVPDDILDAFSVNIGHTRQRNRALFDELTRVLEALSNNGIAAIPLKGPTLALQAYGDLGLRDFRDMDFLIRDNDLRPTMVVLRDLGYERDVHLTEAQIAIIQRLQGQDFVFSKAAGIGVEPHTRLTPIKMAVDVDYAGLWRRAQLAGLGGQSFLMLAPEDAFLVLAIHGGKEMWWNIKWACDIAALIDTYPALDWAAVTQRGRAQGCLRMVLLATALAHKYFHSTIPDEVFDAQRADDVIDPMVRRIAAQWQANEPAGPPSHKTLSRDRFQLHDGAFRRARYAARTLLLPGPHHVAAMPLPGALTFAYVPVKLAHDLIALPLWRAWGFAKAQAECCKFALMDSRLPLAVMPVSAATRSTIQRYRETRKAATRALKVDPNNGAAWADLGNAMLRVERYRTAIDCYDRALSIAPDNSMIWNRRRAAMKARGQNQEFPDAALDPRDAKTWAVRAGGLMDTKRFAEAVAASDRALALDPGNIAAARIGVHSRRLACDWQRFGDDRQSISDALGTGRCITSPMFHRSMCNSEADHLRLAQLWVKGISRPGKPLHPGTPYRHDKIRIAYISSDLRNHVVSHAIASCLENHDRTRFETTAISLLESDGGAMRGRIEAAFDRFIDVHAMSDIAVATMLRDLEIDIAIDLNGYTSEKRTGILAHRPAPVQVNYLGYPGTMAAPFIDYIIADRIVIPAEHMNFYSEKVAYLPHTFMPTDNKCQVAESAQSRSDAGLPDSGIIFACFNNERKIGPDVFNIWMRLLSAVDGSVLWLGALNPSAMGNLRREAKVRGVAPERLVFARRLPDIMDYLARFRLADLFLDTFPYNAHVTASDALRAGLPVLTCLGNTFAGRVAASLLHAIGLPELVTSSPGEYEELALALARNPERLAAIRAKLMHNRATEPLFDTPRFTRGLESALTTMWQRNERGEPPASFAVEPGSGLVKTKLPPSPSHFERP